MNLIIVESPTKAKTFSRYLDKKDYQIEATLGHIRDLPEKKLGIDEKHDFKPDYVLSDKRKVIINQIIKAAKKASSIILATDSDREGEAISYHIAYILGHIKEDWPKATVSEGNIKRIVFHEITKSALEEALKSPRQLNLSLVDAQQTRRLLDRLVGYKLSPLLWAKIGKRWLSAGRVQTVALRFIVEREREIKQFKIESFYRGVGIFSDTYKTQVEAKLVGQNDTSFEIKTSLDLFDGKYTYSKTTIDRAAAGKIESDLKADKFTVTDLEERVYKKTPPPPFITSTLQQQAASRLGYSSKNTMRLAQQLYERGLITYHRTDSVTMSEKFIAQCPDFIKTQYGEDYVATSPRRYSGKSKLAQEAHEAIRPTHLKPAIDLKGKLTSSHQKLYDLIFKRALATQMKEAEMKSIKLKIQSDKKYQFESGFEEVIFAGYKILYREKEKNKVPDIKKGTSVNLDSISFDESYTEPPPRYNEGSLIRTLEKAGIGRPSTYAPTISTIQERQYVEKQDGRFYPTILGIAVCDYLVSEFKDLFAIDFTANLEDDLDNIAEGKEKMVKVIKQLYDPMMKTLEKAKTKKGHINVQETLDEKCPECGKPLLLRFSRHGKFIGCSGWPDCKYARSYVEKIDMKCPKCDTGDIIIKFTKRRRKFFGCSRYPECDFAAWRQNQITKEYAESQDNFKKEKKEVK